MKQEVLVLENALLQDVNGTLLEKFCEEVRGVLAREDYDFSGVHELALFVVLDHTGTNRVEVKTSYTPTHREEVGISLLLSRLRHPIQRAMLEDRFLGINARFYLGLNYTQTLRAWLKTKSGERQKALKQEQENAPNLNLKLEEPRYHMAQIELGKKTKNALLETILLVQKQALIYEEWGFYEVDSVVKTIINLHGKPGTGKTMSAHIIAKELGKKIIHSNYADIESKFVGDAPKNLVAAFDLAQQHSAILFFDEADSFLGKRISNITQSADQALNSLRSELLKLLEERPVIVIFATNLLENYDKAFHSRILRSIHFDLPNKKQRRAIILKHIPSKLYSLGMPELSTEELTLLSRLSKGFSGREIKNAILNGLIMGAKEESLPCFKHFQKAFKASKKAFMQNYAEGNHQPLNRQIKKNLKKGNFKTIRRKKNGQ
ncbi:ATP-binding protein [Helicobacter salomonis]|uniref:ATP-binding protein n=1 Tax=Helicobacter salomonis TaxID=56878 RepID=UPI000CF0F7F4|nr:ATP-binding protein [Helicobacter salomonis]